MGLGVKASRHQAVDVKSRRGERATNLSSEGGGEAGAANAAAARPDDEEIVVVLPGVRDGRHLPVDEHLPRHGWIPNARETNQNKTLGRARNSTPQEEIRPQNRGKRSGNFAGK